VKPRRVNTVVVRQGDEVAGRYRLDELRGHGPMSEVWRAHDETLDRTVALKILSPTADLARFRREAQAVAALGHENVMRVYDYGEAEAEARPFMALEWLSGGTLEDRLAHGPLPYAETHRVAEGIAAGLAHLHGRGLVHRDLKPANVLFDEEGRPKLGDFGLARGAAGSGTLTEAGTVLGTAAYISPEQAVGEPAGAASDVYSFGVILFRMLTGALPFTADNALALIDMHRHAPPPAVETLEPDAPPALAAVADAALRKDPAQRPPDGAALLAALGGAAATAVLPAADTEETRVLRPPAEPPPEEPRWRGTAAAVAGAVVLLAAAGGVLAWAVTRPGSTHPGGGASIGSVADTHDRHTNTTQATPPTTATTEHRQTTQRQPTTTAGHTTIPTTTITPPTTTTSPTTVPTTTVGTTTPTTTSGIGTTTAATGTTS
jgi:eukaryotic-like serine/threonine-protein kinase